ncbi:MAG: double-strand break repair helicase AddA [Micavibrio sp.]|nr:MAG: double-strand break repair helicase AddA [Micavibrio sp.]
MAINESPAPANQPAPPQSDSEDPNIRQRAASDPLATVWVGASAGTGKTKVLTDRVLRLMLPRPGGGSATAPEKILCITFTKAAAAEMALRIHGVLSKWAVMPDDELTNELAQLTGYAPDETTLRTARRLFARVVDTAGGMKIMTIHSFCQSVLSRFPVEAELSPHFEVMDERTAQDHLAECQSGMIRAIRRSENSAPSAAFTRLTRLLNAEQMEALLAELTGNRSRLGYLLAHEGGYRKLTEKIYKALGCRQDETKDSILAEFIRSQQKYLPDLRTACDALSRGTATDQKFAATMHAWLSSGDADKTLQDFHTYKYVFLIKTHAIRAKLSTKQAEKHLPGITDIMRQEAERVLHTLNRLKSLHLAEMTSDVIMIGAHILDSYKERKDQFALLDYDDLIYRTRDLLCEKSSAAWVLFKLDGGIDHILIDEAQDTNPEQWQVIKTLSEEFFAGEGRDGDERSPRSLFVVGDEKQSIYSFQHADPDEFARMRSYFEQRVQEAGRRWAPVDLLVSFRSTPEVLHFVDSLFALPDIRSGVVSDIRTEIRHAPYRSRQPGLVEIWPLITGTESDPEEDDGEEGWHLPLSIRETEDSGMRLAEKIADTIDIWLKNGETLPARGKKIRAGDIMILVRTRNVFVDQCVRALKARDIPVAGVDRMVLNEQIAVMDLIAAAHFSLMPEDDLTLATFLKTPLIGLDEDDLFALCNGRNASLFQAVMNSEKHAPVQEYLRHCIRRAATLPPYGFFAELLNTPCPASEISGRHAILSRLGHDAIDPLEELLNACFQYAGQRIISLQDFLDWFARGETEVKRRQEQDGSTDRVRIMTVHGAKGLQAPIVFLPDTVSHPSNNRGKRNRILWHKSLPIWSPRQDLEDSHYAARSAELSRKEEEEYRRLLYVALTRAEDRLYICGYRKSIKRNPPKDCWYNILYNAMRPLARETDFFIQDAAVQETEDGLPAAALRLENPDAAALAVKDAPEEEQKAEKPKPDGLPAWCRTYPEPDPVPSRPLAPSRILEDEPAARSPLDGKEDKSRFQRGLIIHKLLEILPALPQSGDLRANTLRNYLARPGQMLPDAEQDEIYKEVLAVLNHDEFAPIFGPDSGAEIPFHGCVTRKDGGSIITVSGLIDRLSVTESAVLAVDYKTNRPPPRSENDIPAVYLRQMAMYYAVLQKIYPEKAVRCALLWTDGPFLMPIAPERLEGYTVVAADAPDLRSANIA